MNITMQGRIADIDFAITQQQTEYHHSKIAQSEVFLTRVENSTLAASANEGTSMLANSQILRPRVLLVAGLIAVMSSSISQPATAQETSPNEWTWMAGSNQTRQPAGVYGQLGVAAPGNTPGGRWGTISWTDANGNLWLYGSDLDGFDGAGVDGYLDDVWEYNTSTQEWTWVAGSSTVPTSGLSGSGGGSINGPSPDCMTCAPPPVFGSYQWPAAGNTPGSLQYPNKWIDKEGNLWLFGGFEYYMIGTKTYTMTLNALWEFSVSNHEWAWMGGSNSLKGNTPGVYGTLGQPAAGNTPGGRSGAISWTDSSGNLWLFGGNGLDSAGNTGFLNDLWMFNPSISQWTWMGGSSTFSAGCVSLSSPCSGTGVYGTLQTPAVGNIPQGRSQAFNWMDDNGNVWIFGGATEVSYDINGNFGLESTWINDLWKFNSTTHEWTWMSGNDTFTVIYPGGTFTGNLPGTYGTLGTPSATSTPGGRVPSGSPYGGPTEYTWTDSNGNLWLFGGSGFDSTTTTGTLNDLWKFDPSINEWAWMGGSSTFVSTCKTGSIACSTFGVYGTLGTPAAGSIPGARDGAMRWTDSSGNGWLFGGWGIDSVGTWGMLNDVWKFTPSTNLWTWMGGSNTVLNDGSNSEGQLGVYGFLGVQAATNMPGGRQSAASWTDDDGNFWIFGGTGCDSTYCGGWLNDLWEYEPSVPVIAASFTVAADPGLVTMAADGSAGSGTATITTFASGGFDSAITLAASGQPAGVTVSFSPASITGSGSSTMTITIGSGIAIGSYPIIVTGTSGNISIATTVTLDAWSTTPAAMPTFAPTGGTYTAALPLTISDTTPGATIYYTTNNTAPTTSSNVYSGSITLSSSATVEAIAVAAGYPNSLVGTANFSVNIPVVATPIISLASGTYDEGQTVTISDTTPGATVYYTTDGTIPTTTSTVYSSPITVSSPEGLSAIAMESGDTNSAVADAMYSFSFAPAAQTFRNPYRIPTTQDPTNVFTVDVNGDGILDLLYQTEGNTTTPSTMKVLFGQSSGGYVAGPTLVLPLYVGGCRPVDANHDGKLDLVCLYWVDTNDMSIATFLGNGDGTFQAPIYSGPMQSSGFFGFLGWIFTPADVNGDGFPDLLVSDAYDQWIFVLLGDGTGRFTVKSVLGGYPTAEISGFPSDAAMSITVADINGDGKPDLLFSSGPTILLGNGDGTFKAPATYVGNYFSCVYHDMDGDGHLDAVCANVVNGNQLAILHGNPDGSFNTTPIFTKTYITSDLPNPVAILDLNGDGIPDIVADSSDGMEVLLGGPGLTFANPVHYSVGYPASNGEQSSQFADMNQDGHMDVVAAGPNGIYISYGKGDGTFNASPAYEVAQIAGHVTVADFNGDGIQDIAATGDQSIELSLGNGDGTFKPYTALPNGGIDFSTGGIAGDAQIVHGNFRGHGIQDILAIGSPSTYVYNSYILFGNGDGTFASPQLVPNTSVTFPAYDTMKVLDINKDGRDDVLTTDSSHIYSALSNGDGTFTTVSTVIPTNSSGMNPSFPAFTDFSHDGNLDAAYGLTRSVQILKGHGDGTFDSTGVSLPIPTYQGESPLSSSSVLVATGDFDGDDNPDIATLVEVSSQIAPWTSQILTVVYVYYGNGDGTFSSPVVAGAFNREYTRIFAADVNKDGLADLILQTNGAEGVMAAPSGDGVGVVLSLPGRLFSQEQNYTGGQTESDLVIADFNGDGYPDLLAVNSGYFPNGNHMSLPPNTATMLLNLGAQSTATGVATSTTVVTSNSSTMAGTSVTFTATVTNSTPGANTPTGSVTFADQTGIRTSVFLVPGTNSTATATLTTSSIGIGSDVMSATYLGDSVFASSSALVSQTVTGNPVVITFSATPNPSPTGQGFTINFGVANPPGASVPAPTGGYLNFTDGTSTFLGSDSLNRQAFYNSYNVSLATPGVHTLTAWYSGDEFHASSSATTTETVLIQPVLSYPSVPPTILTTQSVQIQETVSGASGYPTPTGTITLTCCAGTSGSPIVYTAAPVTLSNGSGTINIPAGALPITTTNRDNWLTISYSPDAAASSTYMSNSYSFYVSVEIVPTITVTPPSPSISSAQPLNLTIGVSGGSGNPVPTGSVTVQGGGYSNGYGQALSNGSVTVTIPAGTLTLGNDQLTVSYIADYASLETYTYNSRSVSVTVSSGSPALQTPTVTVSPSASSITTAQALSVSVDVSGGTNKSTATGSVTLSGGGYTSTGTPLSSGSATFNISEGSLATGTDTLTANYAPDSNSSSDYTNASGTAPITVIAPCTACFTVSGTAASVARGATSGNTSTISVTPFGGFTGNVALTAAITSNPAGAQYPPTLSFGSTTPVSITGTNSGTATLTISTTAATSALLYNPEHHGFPWHTEGGAALACILLIGIPARRRRWRTMLGMLALLVTLSGGVLACGGGGCGGIGTGANNNPGTTAGAYTITVSGTSGTTTATGTVTLNVQ